MTSYANGLLRMPVLSPTVIPDDIIYSTMIEHIQRLVQTNKVCIKSRYTRVSSLFHEHTHVCSTIISKAIWIIILHYMQLLAF